MSGMLIVLPARPTIEIVSVIDCSQPSIFSHFNLIFERAYTITTERGTQAKKGRLNWIGGGDQTLPSPTPACFALTSLTFLLRA